MKMTTTFAALALAGSAFFSSQAFAVDNVWFEVQPWGDITDVTDYAEWHTFTGRYDTTPQIGSNGTVNAQAGVFRTSAGNLYHIGLGGATANYNFILKSNGAIGDVFESPLPPINTSPMQKVLEGIKHVHQHCHHLYPGPILANIRV